MTGWKAVFLDRDGTLLRNQHYGCDPDSIRFAPGAIKGLRRLKKHGYLLVLVTNQSGIARGFFSEQQLQAMHRRMSEMLAQEGVFLDGIHYCPHHPQGTVPQYSIECACRKPRPGMLLQARRELGIDLSASWMMGDILDDVESGHRAGCRSILVDVGTEGEPESAVRAAEYVARDFLDAVRHLLSAAPSISPSIISEEVAVG